MNEKLMPCPFCGGENIYVVYKKQTGVPSGGDGYLAEGGCPDCHLTMRFWALKKTWTRESFYKTWNRRPQPANEPLTIEQLKQMDGEPVFKIVLVALACPLCLPLMLEEDVK